MTGYTVFAIVSIIAGLWLSRMVRIATEREIARQEAKRRAAALRRGLPGTPDRFGRRTR
jgi:hypothetical protein